MAAVLVALLAGLALRVPSWVRGLLSAILVLAGWWPTSARFAPRPSGSAADGALPGIRLHARRRCVARGHVLVLSWCGYEQAGQFLQCREGNREGR